jgi:hypothetical protein
MIVRMTTPQLLPVASTWALLAAFALGTLVACGDGGSSSSTGLTADQIPGAHTPPGGYGDDFPAPILAGCTEPLVDGAPDLRGMWKAIDVMVNDAPAPPEHRAWRHFQRIEQCGDRIVITAGGVIHDMRADGTVENGVHDVAGIPIEVRRRRDGAELVFDYAGGVRIRLARTGPPESAPPSFD